MLWLGIVGTLRHWHYITTTAFASRLPYSAQSPHHIGHRLISKDTSYMHVYDIRVPDKYSLDIYLSTEYRGILSQVPAPERQHSASTLVQWYDTLLSRTSARLLARRDVWLEVFYRLYCDRSYTWFEEWNGWNSKHDSHVMLWNTDGLGI